MELDLQPLNPTVLADMLSDIIDGLPSVQNKDWRDMSDVVDVRDQVRATLVEHLAISGATDLHSVAVGVSMFAGVLLVHPTAEMPLSLALHIVRVIDMLEAEV